MRNDVSQKRALLAPLHYFTGAEVGGSEFQWSYEIATEMSRHVGCIDAVVGNWRGGSVPQNVTVHETGLDDSADYFSEGNLFKRLKFIARYTRIGASLIREDRPDILHHVLPFGPETFNPLILARNTLWPGRRTRVIIGPVQAPHQQHFESERDLNRFSGSGRARHGIGSTIQEGLYRSFTSLGNNLCAATLNRADSIIAVTSGAKRMLESLGCSRPIEVIPSGTRPERFSCPDRSGRIGALNIIVANYLVKRKGCELILDALAALKAAGVSFTCKVAGSGPEQIALQKQVENLQIGDAVQLIGMKTATELADLYADADVFVSMSWAEGLPTALMEAMSAGLPILSADNDGAVELVKPGMNGTLVPRGDSQALARALEWYAVHREERLRQGQAARDLALQRYNWSVICDQYSALYAEL